MAAIDYFGNLIRVTAAGTCTYENLEIECAYVWNVNTTASLIVTDVTSGSTAQMLRYSTPNQLASYDPLHLSGKFGRLSFDTVTACTAWIVKR